MCDAYMEEGYTYKPEKIDIIVTRHKGLVEYLKERGLLKEDVQIIQHADNTDSDTVKGKVVLGNLPFFLAAKARKVIVPVLELTPEDRGKELTKEEVKEKLRGLRGYIVKEKLRGLRGYTVLDIGEIQGDIQEEQHGREKEGKGENMNKKISYQDWRELNPIQIAKMLEKYPEKWWGYITALRGPDVENSFESPFREIKVLFSGFLRALIDEIPDIKYFEKLMNKLSEDEKEFKRIVKGIPKIPAHYYEHCYDAFYVIRNYLELTPKFVEFSEALSYLAYEARAGRKGKIPQALKNVIKAYHEAKEEKHEG